MVIHKWVLSGPIADTCFEKGLKITNQYTHVLRFDAEPVSLTDQLKFFWDLKYWVNSDKDACQEIISTIRFKKG